jgi:predicted RNase H-like HicB family nuclease
MTRRVLEDYLAMQYPFQVIADPDGGYVVVFPDLPGCMTQAETIDEIPAAAEDARRSWITAVYEDGEAVPLPSYPEEYSGKLVARLPRSLHRHLAEEAGRQGVSLNQHMVALLSRRDAQARLEQRVADVEERLSAKLDLISEQVDRLRFPITHMPSTSDRAVRSLARRPASQREAERYRDQVAV